MQINYIIINYIYEQKSIKYHSPSRVVRGFLSLFFSNVATLWCNFDQWRKKTFKICYVFWKALLASLLHYACSFSRVIHSALFFYGNFFYIQFIYLFSN